MRTAFLKVALVKYHEILKEPLPTLTESFEVIASNVEAIDATTDSETFAASLTASEQIPMDFDLYEPAVLLYTYFILGNRA
jgi:hypothetical protein